MKGSFYLILGMKTRALCSGDNYFEYVLHITECLMGLLQQNNLTLEELKIKEEFSKFDNIDLWLCGFYNFNLHEIIAIQSYFDYEIVTFNF